MSSRPKRAKTTAPKKLEWHEDEKILNRGVKIFVEEEEPEARSRKRPQIKVPPVTNNCEVALQQCQHLVKNNPSDNEVLAELYQLNDNDKEFCRNEQISKFDLQRFFTNASRAIHDRYFVPSPAFMIGIDPETFDKLKEYYEQSLKTFKEKTGYHGSDVVPKADTIPHMSEIPAPGTPFFTCFVAPKMNLPIRKQLSICEEGYEKALAICQEVHTIHSNAADFVAQHASDLAFAQMLSEQHKLRFADYDDNYKVSNLVEDGCNTDTDADKYRQDFPCLSRLADVLEDLDADSDSDVDLENDEEFMDVPKASDEYVEMVDMQAAAIHDFSVLGFSTLVSSELREGREPKDTYTGQRPQRILKANRKYTE